MKDGNGKVVVDVPRELGPALADGSRVVVTGCAGFIGSHLTEALLDLGCLVTGVDSLNDYYDPAQKREHLSGFEDHPRFELHQADLNDLDAVALLDGATAVFHLAAQAGVRASWGEHFQDYLDRNLKATQRLLEACKEESVARGLVRFVYSSSSSIYGDRTDLPVAETALPQPFSPYGVTKLAAEHLCVLYAANFDVPVTALRYFTVFGPRQRPDMAFRKFIEAALDGRPWHIFGDGNQTRDFTFVADAVVANLLAVAAPGRWGVYNVGGGARISLREALDVMRGLLASAAPGVKPVLEHVPTEKGDVRDTWSAPDLAREAIGYESVVPFADGLRQEIAWVLERRRRLGG
ncbi:NAD-dependent epimerase/dehydratase family protein [bacterium]|nr:NAD-dependent epimerase/dehydratase family protein [bacterium]MBU1073669.1 NAD-dependent epimerase/dehydratase family protein [bacterium]MBU1675324.1 NAD-dependent epimerase/dehydratase family protein [bacterium]